MSDNKIKVKQHMNNGHICQLYAMHRRFTIGKIWKLQTLLIYYPICI